MGLRIHPGPVEGTVAAPSSKSMTHRAMFTALVAGGGTVSSPLWSEDTRASHTAIKGFGAATVATRDELVVRGARLQPAELDVANSGTTLRIATAIAALTEGESRLAGDASLNTRPMGPLADALRQLGADVTLEGEAGTPPVVVEGPIRGGECSVDARTSSQFVTALLVAAPRMPEGLRLTVKGEVASKPYVDLTCRVLENAGVPVTIDDDTYAVDHHDLPAVHVPVPGDYSAAAFPLVASAATGGHVSVVNLPEDTGQGDERVAEFLGEFGVTVERERDTLTVRGRATEPVELDLRDNPDLFPALAVLAATVEGTSELAGAPHLRDKESDRIQAVVDGLDALGVETEALEGGARIQGGTIAGGTVDSRGDHRIQMAFAAAGLAAQQPVTITGPVGAHEVSYPGFLDAMADLGATIDAEEEGAG